VKRVKAELLQQPASGRGHRLVYDAVVVEQSPPTPPTLGLTGGIGAGKSTVARILAEEGCLVCDSDALAREALNHPSIRAEILSWWGDRVRAPDGAIDRAKLGEVVFSSLGDRKRLESLVHPWIERHREQLFASPPPGTRALVVDAPLLLEAGFGSACHRVIFVDSPLELRLERVRANRGWSAEELARREAAQWPLDQKRACAHHVVSNEGDPASLRVQVRAVLDEACSRPGSPA
jgi:dephospho-CoA kinase